MIDNPGPGALFCPLCHAVAWSRNVRFFGFSGDEVAWIECPACQKWGTQKWLTWNEVNEKQKGKDMRTETREEIECAIGNLRKDLARLESVLRAARGAGGVQGGENRVWELYRLGSGEHSLLCVDISRCEAAGVDPVALARKIAACEVAHELIDNLIADMSALDLRPSCPSNVLLALYRRTLAGEEEG